MAKNETIVVLVLSKIIREFYAPVTIWSPVQRSPGSQTTLLAAVARLLLQIKKIQLRPPPTLFQPKLFCSTLQRRSNFDCLFGHGTSKENQQQHQQQKMGKMLAASLACQIISRTEKPIYSMWLMCYATSTTALPTRYLPKSLPNINQTYYRDKCNFSIF